MASFEMTTPMNLPLASVATDVDRLLRHDYDEAARPFPIASSYSFDIPQAS
jgi:hypothetical protein